MGVTYKLKQEVVDLIVQKKREDPSLSCRKLVDILYETFHIDVSKSSVNAVIKEFDLSNPVGRRSGKAPKNFFIPPERKQQLLAQVAPFLPPAPAPEPESQPEPAVEITKPFVIQEQTEEQVHLLPDLIAPVSKDQVLAPEEPPKTKGPLLANMGYYFIYALMQDILRRPLLGRVLSFAAGMDEADDRILEAAVFARAMGLSSVGDPEGKVYGALSGIFDADPQQTEDLLVRFFGKNISVTALRVAFEAELATALVSAAFVKCVGDTGRDFYLSSDLGALLPGPEAARGCPMFKAVECAADRFLVRKRPLVFDLHQGLDRAGQDFLLLLDGKGADRMDRIELWDRKGDVLWSSLLKGDRQYKFIACLCDKIFYDKEFSSIDVAGAFTDPVFQQAYELKEGFYILSDSSGLKFRAILVETKPGVEKTILLTNIPEKELKKNDILEIYLDNRPGIAESLHNDLKNSTESHVSVGCMFEDNVPSGTGLDLNKILDEVFRCFERYASKALFQDIDNNDVMQKLYPLPAHMVQEVSRVQVCFEPEKTFAHADDLSMAIQRANSLCIRDYLGRRVCFSLLIDAEK